MRKFLALLLTLVLFSASVMPGFAATSAVSIPKEVLSLINPLNYSVESNDESDAVLKWLNASNLKEPFKTGLLNLNEGTQLGGEYLDFTGYLSYREITKAWAVSGKADAKLGQGYESKVNLLIGQVGWECYSIQTNAWVKKTGTKYALTKVQYTVTASKPSLKGKQFMDKNQMTLDENYYANLSGLYAYLYDIDLQETSFDGIHVKAGAGATLYEDYCISTYDTSHLKPDMAYLLATVTVDNPVIFDTNFKLYGFKEGVEYDESVFDVSADDYLEYKDGWLLEPGKTYEYYFSAKGQDDNGNDGQYYTESQFVIKPATK